MYNESITHLTLLYIYRSHFHLHVYCCQGRIKENVRLTLSWGGARMKFKEGMSSKVVQKQASNMYKQSCQTTFILSLSQQNKFIFSTMNLQNDIIFFAHCQIPLSLHIPFLNIYAHYIHIFQFAQNIFQRMHNIHLHLLTTNLCSILNEVNKSYF